MWGGHGEEVKRLAAGFAPKVQMVLWTLTSFAMSAACQPPFAKRLREGKYAARAIPTCALATAIWRSASATSGRRSRRSEGKPALIVGGSASNSFTGR